MDGIAGIKERTNMIRILLGRFRWLLLFILVLLAPQTLAQPGHLGAILGAIEDPYPLRSADTSSPRDTLRTYMRDISTAVDAWQSDKPRADIARPLLRAADTIDFGELRGVDRFADMTIKMILLKEILDRVELPPFEDIPDDEEAAEQGIVRWSIPNTKIEIAKISEGRNAGEFLFTKETIENLDDYYTLAKDLPYKKGASVGLYEEVLSSPGVLLPRELANNFPDWAKEIVLGQGVWQWISICLLFIISAVIMRFLYRQGSRWDAKHTISRPSVRFGVPLALLGSFLIAHLVGLASFTAIGLFETPYVVVSTIALVVKIASLAMLAVVLAGRLADGVAFSQENSAQKRRVDPALLRVVFRLVSVVVLAYLGIYAAEAVGIPIAPLVAGLGVGGLAIALAAQPSIENLIGGLSLFADKAIRVGDYCQCGTDVGTVEAIGIRSTRLRGQDRSLTTIPNSTLSKASIVNLAERDRMLMQSTIGLRYETRPDQLRHVLIRTRELLLGHPRIAPDSVRVRFMGFGASSLDVEIFAYVATRDRPEFLAIREELFLRLMDLVQESGTGFAFPSQTLYFARDEGLDPGRTDAAVAEVRRWRDEGRLTPPATGPTTPSTRSADPD